MNRTAAARWIRRRFPGIFSKREARKKINASSKGFRKYVKKLKDAGVCENCFTHEELTVHHIDPSPSMRLWTGEPLIVANLKVLCGPCHRKEERRRKESTRWKLLRLLAPPDKYAIAVLRPLPSEWLDGHFLFYNNASK